MAHVGPKGAKSPGLGLSADEAQTLAFILTLFPSCEGSILLVGLSEAPCVDGAAGVQSKLREWKALRRWGRLSPVTRRPSRAGGAVTELVSTSVVRGRADCSTIEERDRLVQRLAQEKIRPQRVVVCGFVVEFYFVLDRPYRFTTASDLELFQATQHGLAKCFGADPDVEVWDLVRVPGGDDSVSDRAERQGYAPTRCRIADRFDGAPYPFKLLQALAGADRGLVPGDRPRRRRGPRAEKRKRCGEIVRVELYETPTSPEELAGLVAREEISPRTLERSRRDEHVRAFRQRGARSWMCCASVHGGARRVPSDRPGKAPVQQRLAEAFLWAELQKGPKRKSELIAKTLARGHSRATTERAAAALGVVSERVPRGREHIWRLPEDLIRPSDAPHGPRPPIDWSRVRDVFIEQNLNSEGKRYTLCQLSRDLGLSYASMRRHSSDEGWPAALAECKAERAARKRLETAGRVEAHEAANRVAKELRIRAMHGELDNLEVLLPLLAQEDLKPRDIAGLYEYATMLWRGAYGIDDEDDRRRPRPPGAAAWQALDRLRPHRFEPSGFGPTRRFFVRRLRRSPAMKKRPVRSRWS